MISCNQGHVQIEGSKADIYSELSILMHILMDKKILTEEEMYSALKYAFKSDREIHNEVTDYLLKMAANHKKPRITLDDVFGDLLDE